MRPERRGLDAVLLENNLAFSVGNYGVSCFPFYRVVRMDAQFRVASLVSEFPSGGLGSLTCFHAPCHSFPPCHLDENRASSLSPHAARLKSFVQIRTQTWQT